MASSLAVSLAEVCTASVTDTAVAVVAAGDAIALECLGSSLTVVLQHLHPSEVSNLAKAWEAKSWG